MRRAHDKREFYLGKRNGKNVYTYIDLRKEKKMKKNKDGKHTKHTINHADVQEVHSNRFFLYWIFSSEKKLGSND